MNTNPYLKNDEKPKYLILLHNKDKIIYAKNLQDVVQTIKSNRTFATIYKAKEPENKEYYYFINMTGSLTEIDEINTQDEV